MLKPRSPSREVARALDVVKATMVGAHVTQMVSALLGNGPGHLRTVRGDLKAWLNENEWNSLGEMRGNMSLARVPDPATYERENFQMMLRSHAVPSRDQCRIEPSGGLRTACRRNHYGVDRIRPSASPRAAG